MTVRVLKKKTCVTSPTSNRRYRVVRPLGEGGFGCAYEVVELGSRDRVVGTWCLKVTDDQLSWNREAYYGELLRGQGGAIQLEESFVRTRRTRHGSVLDFYLVSEFANGGDLTHHLAAEAAKSWSARKVRTQAIKLLRLLAVLHGAGISHRDLTPHNVFVTNGGLKVGDWGIARGSLGSRLARLDGRNEAFTPPNFRGLPRDDTWMLGQLIAMLLSADADRPWTVAQVKPAQWDRELKRVVLRAIGPTRTRYSDAHAMLADLDEHARRNRRLTTLAKKNVCFTGALTMGRNEAIALVERKGGFAQNRVSSTTDVLVRGSPSPAWSRGTEGRKLIAAHMFGVRIIGEKKFRSLLRGARR